MTGLKLTFLSSVIGSATLAVRQTMLGSAAMAAGSASDIADGVFGSAERLGQMTATAVLGAVAVVCSLALCAVYTDMKRIADAKLALAAQNQEALAALLTASVEATTKAASAVEHNTGIMVEVKNAIIHCTKHGG